MVAEMFKYNNVCLGTCLLNTDNSMIDLTVTLRLHVRRQPSLGRRQCETNNINKWNKTLQNHHSTASTTPDPAQGYASGPIVEIALCHEFACPIMPNSIFESGCFETSWQHTMVNGQCSMPARHKGQWSMPARHKASPFWAQAVKRKKLDYVHWFCMQFNSHLAKGAEIFKECSPVMVAFRFLQPWSQTFVSTESLDFIVPGVRPPS